jgi:hypothetical protein
MKSLRQNEGVILLDHRNSPGVPDAVMQKFDLPAGSGKGVFEAPTYTCSHCQSIVVMNPNRQRERGYCRGCDHNICDTCWGARANGAKCKTFKQVIDEILENAEKQIII